MSATLSKDAGGGGGGAGGSKVSYSWCEEAGVLRHTGREVHATRPRPRQVLISYPRHTGKKGGETAQVGAGRPNGPRHGTGGKRGGGGGAERGGGWAGGGGG